MAHQVEPMDIDSDFDNKENSLHHNNVLPFTEKGYEELDVSELNMKLRYSVTPASSPMSKSLTTSCNNRTLEAGDESFNISINENVKLTCSLNSTLTKNENTVSKSPKTLPLQCIITEQLVDNNTSVLRPLDSTNTSDNGNVTVAVTGPSDADENFSLPSSSSSTPQTPEATTPTKEIPIKDGGSPIMRGLKSVLNMFRSSQSPIPSTDNDNVIKSEILSPADEAQSTPESKAQFGLASTPIASQKKKEMSPTKRNSPIRDKSIVFNDDLEKELQWKDETTIIFSQERIPIHKLMLQQPQDKKKYNEVTELLEDDIQDIDSTVEYMDISYNDSFADKTMTDATVDHKKSETITESDNEFVDCETTFTQNDEKDMTHTANQTQELDSKTHIQNDSGSRLKPIILDTTQDILDATLSVRPEDLLPDGIDESNSNANMFKEETKCKDTHKHSSSLQENQPVLDNTINITDPLTVTQPEDHNSNKSIAIISTTGSNNQTFDESRPPNNEHKENLDGTVTIINSLSGTINLENHPNVSTTTFVVHDESLSSSLENGFVVKTNSAVDSEAKLTFLTESELIAEIPISSTVDLSDGQSLANSAKEISKTELPIDIPLPDEDDIDKEFNVPINSTPDITLPISLPIDPAEDIKVITEISEADKTLKEVQESDNITNVTESTKILKKIWENPAYVNTEQETSSGIACLLTEVVSSLIDKEIVLHDKMRPENVEAHKTESFDTMQRAENIEDHNKTYVPHDTNKQEVLSLNITESACESKPLPDVINQTILLSNTESLEENLNTLIPIETKPVETSQSLIPEEIEQKVAPAGHLQSVPQAIELKAELPCTTAENIVVSTYQKDMVGLETSVNELKTDEFVGTPKENSLFSTVEEPTSNSKVQVANREEEEEIVLSENNSPFVSVIADNISETKPRKDTNNENLEDSLATTTKEVITPPISPPIKSKGYNFNFDETDFDPFATKTKIRMSPPLDSPNKFAEDSIQIKISEKPVPKKDFNRRRSQTERKKSTGPKRKLNSTIDAKITDNVIEGPQEKTEIASTRDIELASPATIALNQNNVTPEENKLNQTDDIPQKFIETTKDTSNSETKIVQEDKAEQPVDKFTKESNSVLVSSQHELKTTSSSEQSVYYSADSESSLPSKNVFNLPEIDDAKFHPLGTKSKRRQSPSLIIDNPFTTKNKIQNSPNSSMIVSEEIKPIEDKIETEPIISVKTSEDVNTTSSTSNAHTEDEDTVEGPFFEDLIPDDKMLDFDAESDMMQFNELPAQSNEDNLDTGEMFIDAEAFEFLLNQNKCNTVVDSGKESLFLKFDPLFAKRMSAVTSDGVVASLAKLQKKQSTPIKATSTLPSPVAGPSNINSTQDMDMSEEFNDDLNITVSKPMMVVPPAVNPVTRRNKSLTPNRSNRRSITFTSPAMAVIDRLLSLSGNNSLVHDTTVTQTSREQNEADIALSQLRELLAEKEISVYNLRSESNDLKDRLSSLEGHVKSLEAESEVRLKKINELTDTLAEKTKINKSMAAVVEEYERTIASLIAETAQDKKRHAEERIKLINERDEQTAHLASMEVSFSDLHSKYEKSKQVILNCKANEDAYKKSIKEFEENLTKMQNNYELLKQHATSKLNHANQELEKINRSHEAEVLKLNAMIKRKELHITSLEESLAQKTKANEELTAICDELINKVG